MTCLYTQNTYMARRFAASLTLVFFVLTTALISDSFSQARLVGRVADEENQPLAAAIVYVISPNFTQATLTNASGYFTFLDLPIGNYLLKAYKRGLPTWQKDISLSSPSTIRLDVKLAEKPTTLAAADAKTPSKVTAKEPKERDLADARPTRPKPEQAPKPEQEKKEPERTAAPLPPEPKAETLSDADIDKDEGLRQSVEEAKLTTASDAIKPDTKPELIGGMEALNQKIIYPAIARERGLQGGVIAKVSVDPLGFVRKVTILRSTDVSFSEEVFRVLSEDVRFKPAMLNGKPVAAAAVIYVEFKLN
jgi:protein TonB